MERLARLRVPACDAAIAVIGIDQIVNCRAEPVPASGPLQLSARSIATRSPCRCPSLYGRPTSEAVVDFKVGGHPSWRYTNESHLDNSAAGGFDYNPRPRSKRDELRANECRVP